MPCCVLVVWNLVVEAGRVDCRYAGDCLLFLLAFAPCRARTQERSDNDDIGQNRAGGEEEAAHKLAFVRWLCEEL